MVPVDGSAETALNVLSVRFPAQRNSQGGCFPFFHGTGCRRHLNCSDRRNFAAFFRHGGFAHVGNFHCSGDHFFRRHGLTDTADPATKHIHRAIRKTDFIGPDITSFKPAYKPFLAFLSRFPGQRKTGITRRFLSLPGRGPVRVFIIQVVIIASRILPSSRRVSILTLASRCQSSSDNGFA